MQKMRRIQMGPVPPAWPAPRPLGCAQRPPKATPKEDAAAPVGIGAPARLPRITFNPRSSALAVAKKRLSLRASSTIACPVFVVADKRNKSFLAQVYIAII